MAGRSVIMADTFIMHPEWILDLPQEYQNVFLRYIFDYGTQGIVPNLTGLENTVWIKIQRQIDDDKARRQAQVENGKKGGAPVGNNNAAKNNQKQPTTSENNPIQPNSTQNNPIQPNSSENNLNVYGNVYDNVNEYGEGDVHDADKIGVKATQGGISPSPPPQKTQEKTQNTGDVSKNSEVVSNCHVFADEIPKDEKNDMPVSDFLSPPQRDYCQQVYDFYKKHNLPCRDIVSFQSDFYNTYSLRKGHHPDDILKALENYVKVLENPNYYYTYKHNFADFLKPKTLNKFLPGYFVADNFKNWDVQKNEQEQENAKPKLTEQEKKMIALKATHPTKCKYCGGELYNLGGDGYDWICKKCKRDWQLVNEVWTEDKLVEFDTSAILKKHTA